MALWLKICLGRRTVQFCYHATDHVCTFFISPFEVIISVPLACFLLVHLYLVLRLLICQGNPPVHVACRIASCKFLTALVTCATAICREVKFRLSLMRNDRNVMYDKCLSSLSFNQWICWQFCLKSKYRERVRPSRTCEYCHSELQSNIEKPCAKSTESGC